MNWLWFILIGLAAGFLAGAVVKGSGFGLLGNLIVGVIGAVLGGFIFSLLGIGATNLLGALVCAFVGSVVLLLLIGVAMRKRS
jgi:uncharacterized membrane protein YeaQ/YmgE (transglycosylase-associated protein family)